MALAFKYLVPDEHGDIEIAGTGVRAYDVIGQRKFCEKVEDLVEAFPTCPLAAIYEAMAYALENPDEMEAIRQVNMVVQEQVLEEARERIRTRLGK